ncbi:MAG: VCBS repeat-containing protein [Alphaproteobacteria bacterium]|jgi:hypothetical protein|nr:VCBS repeat-containing protein [Alphaproteobacteria bacterium]MBT4966126.1 VCBS repeat-containing protein [Alphaproteobacteria bacterium]
MPRKHFLPGRRLWKLRFVSAIATWIVIIFAPHGSIAGSDVRFLNIVPPVAVQEITAEGGRIVIEGRLGQQYQMAGFAPPFRFVLRGKRPVRQKPKDGLPDGEITVSDDDKMQGWLTGPTRQYDHAVLGDDIEATGFRIKMNTGEEINYRLSPHHVFEDRRIRFLDIDGDKKPELVAVKSGFDGGARIAAYSIRQGRIVPFAESAVIGKAYRWLNPVSAADFDGDGDIEIAAVITPHLGVLLRLFVLDGNRLVPDHEAQGFSNHGIGMQDMQLSAVADVNGDGISDILIPNESRTAIRIVTFAGGLFRELHYINLKAKITGDMVLLSDKNETKVLFPLSNANLGLIMIKNPARL